MTTEPAAPPSFDTARVEDVMHPGVLTCPPETPLSVVARMMATYRVHAIIVTDLGEGEGEDEQPWRVLSDLDLAKALVSRGFEDMTAGGMAAKDVVTADSDSPLADAARMMVEQDAAHLVVTGPAGSPVGVLSTLDLARTAAHLTP